MNTAERAKYNADLTTDRCLGCGEMNHADHVCGDLTAEQVGETATGWPLFAVIHPELGVLGTYAAEDADDALEQCEADSL